MPRTVTYTIASDAPYSSSREHMTPMLNDKEGHDDHDARTWREKCHYDHTTRNVCIPAMAFKKALTAAAKRLGMKVPGKRMATYSKFITGGIIPLGDAPLGVKVDDVRMESVRCSSTGRDDGKGQRVTRRYPVVDKWETEVSFVVVDDVLTSAVVDRHMQEAGLTVGVGRFRPENGGFFGRFSVKSAKWSDA